MTTPQRRAVITGLLTLVIGAAVVGVGDMARSSVVFRAELDARLAARDVRNVPRDAAISTLDREMKELKDLTLDILCSEAIRPTDRRCR